MRVVENFGNSHITGLMELMRVLGQCRTPFEALLAFFKGFAEAYAPRAHLLVSTRGLPQGQYTIVRLQGDDGTEHVELRDPWKHKNFAVESGGLLAEFMQNPVPKVVHDIDWSHDPFFGECLRPYHSLMAVPFTSARLPVSWVFVLDRRPTHFTSVDLEGSILRSTLVTALLDSLSAGNELSRANEHTSREIDRLARIQRSLLPNPIPNIPGLDIAASYKTFGQAGGDLYDFMRPGHTPNISRVSSDRWCILIGDAAGHGPSAAVVMAMVHSILHAYPTKPSGPADLLSHLNYHLCRKRIEASYVTAFLGLYDASTRKLTYASAGHPPPLLKSVNNGDTMTLNAAASPALGILEDVTFEEAELQLRPGQKLLLYTDGITEARCPDGNMFGLEKIEQSLRECNGDANTIINHLNNALSNHQCSRRPDDDQTTVAIRVN